MMSRDALHTIVTWAEDRATQRCDPSADPGAKTEERAVVQHTAARPSPLRDWHQRDKPSRHEAATFLTGCPSPLANATYPKFQFTVNQDSRRLRVPRQYRVVAMGLRDERSRPSIGRIIRGAADLRERYRTAISAAAADGAVIVVLVFFLTMTVLTVVISRAGLEIALAFGVGILVTSFVSRWIRSTELRFQGFEFVDDESRRRWEQCCAHDFQILVPHRPGLYSRIERERIIRECHRIGGDTPVILIEAELGDPSDFYQLPLMRVAREDGFELIQVSRCVSVAHVLAAIGLEMAKIGRPPELHFGWSNESPLAANLNFLLFGEGNIPWMVRALLRKAEPNPAKQPLVIIG